MQAIADELTQRGEVPYLVPEGGSNALGACGYVAAVRELLAQGPVPDRIVVATGSGGTLAGIALGLEDAGVATHVVGVAVCDDAPYFEAIVERIADDAYTHYGLPRLSPGRYSVLDKLPKVGADAVRKEIVEAVGLADPAIDKLFGLLFREVRSDADLVALGAEIAESPVGQTGIAGLRELLSILDGAGMGEHVAVDLTIARGLDYYLSLIHI